MASPVAAHPRHDSTAGSEATFGRPSGATIVRLWPFVAAYLRQRISKDELTDAFQRMLGESGRDLSVRIALAATLGPVYVWYLLAKGVMQLGPSAEEKPKSIRCLEYAKASSQT